LTFSAWTESALLNVNTWFLSIGTTDLLTWQKNKMGDVAIVNFDKLSMTDTLFAKRYLCGHSPEVLSVTTLRIKNKENQIIGESTNKINELLFYTASLPLKDVLVKGRTQKGDTLNVYFSIKHQPDMVDKEVLLGRLKLN
jgi:hypothetical protein